MSVPAESHRYYTGQYWNDFEIVRQYLDARITGDPTLTWFEELARDGHHFGRALILNCGTGWVERELHRVGLVDEVIGIDISADLLALARQGAADAGLVATYVEMDTNKVPLPDGPFDLVLNHAAGHHISRIDHVFRQVSDRLSENGLFISWDYVGPHRNQYPAAIWEAAWSVNRELPTHLRQTMRYPHLDTMLSQDPTEAIHSELVLDTIARYFHISRLHRLGGGIGYLLLTHNDSVHNQPLDELEPHLHLIMQADAAFTEQHPHHTLFAYVVAGAAVEPPSDEDLARWKAEEDAREAAAARNGAEYGPRTWLAEVTYGDEAPRPTLGQAVAVRWPRATNRYNRWADWLLARVKRRSESR